jgi:hypothetical protein
MFCGSDFGRGMEDVPHPAKFGLKLKRYMRGKLVINKGRQNQEVISRGERRYTHLKRIKNNDDGKDRHTVRDKMIYMEKEWM